MLRAPYSKLLGALIEPEMRTDISDRVRVAAKYWLLAAAAEI
jgi:hypothetical protein